MPAADQKDLIVIDPTSGKPVCRKDINLAVVHAGGRNTSLTWTIADGLLHLKDSVGDEVTIDTRQFVDFTYLPRCTP